MLNNCATAGNHWTVRFSLFGQNLGHGTVALGRRQDRPELYKASGPLFGQEELIGFNQLTLSDAASGVVTKTQTSGYCLRDVTQAAPWAGTARYTSCEDQGVSAGWSALYDFSQNCEFLLLDTVPDGNYRLTFKTNAKRYVVEDNYSNDTVSDTFTFAR